MSQQKENISKGVSLFGVFFLDKVLPTVLQKAEVSVLSQSECKRAYGPVSPRMLCAGVPSGEQDACRVSTHTASFSHS